MTTWTERGAVPAIAGALMLAACQSGGGAGTAAGGAGPTALAAGYPFEFREECDETVAEELQGLGIAPAAVDNIWYQEQRAIDSRDDRVIGYLAYARMVEQPGLLVVDMNAFCIVNQVYTRDGLSLPGVSAF